MGSWKSGGDLHPLHTAARSGDLNAVDSVLSSNPLAINSRDKLSRTPLHLAAWAGHVEVVSYLCKHKADVGAAAMDDMAAIHFAAQRGYLEVVRTLLSSGVSVKASNRKGMTALHYAAQGSHLELAKYLIKKGANLNAKTKSGKTSLDLATNEDMRSLLLECGRRDNLHGETGKEKVVEKDTDADLGGGKAVENEGQEGEQEDIKRRNNEENDDDDGKDSSPRAKKTKLTLQQINNEDDGKERSPKPKKTKVTLNHLLASDDTQGDADNQ
ncbi:hypothetical protein Nepgr_010991 [Nepenthes gracilis]|uniref:Uncharacterized protein n=1 Tax=Nepenthes gracilis TaxID=150966 RepID=A0AAD3XLY4_NEPGR|nr:hypothetical protein Nepgr_010991 [Nepenthes gracilis]